MACGRDTWAASRGRCGTNQHPSCAPWTSSLALELHVGDLDLGEPLPMPGVAPVPRAPGEPVDLDLLALAVSHDLGRHLRSLEHRLSGLPMLPVTPDQHAVEPHLRPPPRDHDPH